MNGMRIESTCVFGSRARRSMDQISDLDVLVICSDAFRLRQIRGHWQNGGWSVASFTPNRFEKMVASGSLFVQHLKLEGIILEDKNSWLQRILDQAKPNGSYERDAKKSVNLALPIERFSAESFIEDNLVVADIAYVAVRNFGICHLANKGKSVFDYSEIVNHLSDDFALDPRDLTSLKNLRLAKAAYRSGEECNQVLGTVQELRNTLSTFFPHRPLSEISRYSPIRELGGGYLMLRDFEATIISHLGRHPLNCEVDALGLGKIWSWVQDPRAYSWNVRNLSCRSIRQFLFHFGNSTNVPGTLEFNEHADYTERSGL